MNKAAFVLAVADLTGDPIPDVTRTVDAMLKVMIHTVASGEPVSLTGWGTLRPQFREARQARNPVTNDTVQVPEQFVIRFRPANRFTGYTNDAVPLPPTAADVELKRPVSPRTAPAPQASEQGAL
jgi:DNA-binding protein HU-beta